MTKEGVQAYDKIGEALGAAIYQVQIVNDNPYEGPVYFISRQTQPTVARYGASQMEFLSLYGPWKNFITIIMELCLKHMLRWQIAIQEYRGNMTIVHKAESIHKKSDGLSRWSYLNTPDSLAYVPTTAEPQIPIEGINIADVGTEFFEEVREIYNQDKNCLILTSLLERDFKDTALANSLDDIWKTSYDN
ncbi:hypothetical protein O181_087057 [Austropuccinia psidii MF-1]|uniref:Uncharacterized protein n=1 Tax=Austropuccinia psidii MF-1 TaxID=1389203 RepID=A0A9Q3P2G9_9BASI|nr:hypothetical protein [Austropuccinia psidii MF-1]